MLAKQFLVSPPITRVKLSVFTQAQKRFRFVQSTDLKGRIGAKLLGMSLGEKLDDFSRHNLVIEEAVDLRALFKMLEYGRVDYVVMYEEAAQAFLKQHALQNRIVALDKALGFESVHFLGSPRSHCIKKLARFFDGETDTNGNAEQTVSGAQSSDSSP